MLGLPASAPVIKDKTFCSQTRQLRPVVLLNHSENEVEPGRHAGGRPDWTVDDKYAVIFDPNFGVPVAQIARIEPVRGCTSPVEKASFGQHEGASTDRRDPTASRKRPPYEIEQPVR